MESRSYMFSTGRKRSTLLESKGIEYITNDSGSREKKPVHLECPNQFKEFKSCLEVNSSNPERCSDLRDSLFECGKPAIRKANTDKSYTY